MRAEATLEKHDTETFGIWGRWGSRKREKHENTKKHK